MTDFIHTHSESEKVSLKYIPCPTTDGDNNIDYDIRKKMPSGERPKVYLPFKDCFWQVDGSVPVPGLCVKCGGKTIKHDDENHIEDGTFDPYKVKIGQYTIECPSGHTGIDYEIWHRCLDCGENHLECPECHCYLRLKKFTGQKRDDGEEEDGQKYQIVNKNGTYVLKLEVYGDSDLVSIPAKLKIYSINFSTWYLTGIDGSKFSKFKCDSCRKKIKTFD